MVLNGLVLELEDNVLVRQLLVDRRERLRLVLHLLRTLRAQEHLYRLATLATYRRLLPNALTRIHQVLDDRLVHGRQCVAVGTHTIELVGTTVVLAQDGSLGDEDDGTTLELLLELGGEAGLDESEGLEELVGHEDDDGLLVSSDVDFLGGGELEGLEGFGEILGLLGDFSDFVGEGGLEVVGGDSVGLGDEFHVLRRVRGDERGKEDLQIERIVWVLK